MSAPTFKVACVQTTSEPEVSVSMAHVGELVRAAASAGADFITTPECVSMMEPRRRRVLEKATDEGSDQALSEFCALAKETGKWLLAGSLIIKVEEERCANRSFLIGPDGSVVAHYDKVHMFDVSLADGESYRESRTYRPGTRAVVAELPWGKLGMTVCYDMRFPYLYRTLAHAGATLLTVPSAFTRPTGRAHWHTLLRARAIETGCFVFAPAQCGEHPGGRKTYGHSLIIDPWGEILAEAGEEPGFVVADINMERVSEVRKMVPSLEHDRTISVGESSKSTSAAAD
ncbi:MAG: carbon-nitrogen hydrolase family protein [Gammaproteobacteria bacterium]|nr:carbon-nitrogen hydrolase family protein [Gammaproteobacteria bacterium]